MTVFMDNSLVAKKLYENQASNDSWTNKEFENNIRVRY